jgi:hypothetical protein
LSLQK